MASNMQETDSEISSESEHSDEHSEESSSDEEDQDGSEASENEEEEESEVKLPKLIRCDDVIVSLSCHPNEDILLAALMDGTVKTYSYSRENPNELKSSLQAHKKACRGVAFSHDGTWFSTISKDKSLRVFDTASGKQRHRILKAHDDPIYSHLVIDEKLVATGDDEGRLKIWDLRQQEAIVDFKEHEEYISDMDIDKDKRILVATSGDSSLSAYNIRQRKFLMQSESLHNDMMCVQIVKRGRKVVTGAGDGALNIFNWNEFGNISTRFPGHPQSIDRCVAVNENIICTGSMDGKIRAVHILPNRFLGVVGEHPDFPIEDIVVTHDSEILASCAHDQKIKFWSVDHLHKTEVDARAKAVKKNKDAKFTPSGKHENFFADME